MYDILIVGAGPAGLTAALYALRANKSVLLIEKGTFGGQITYSPKIENYPGFLQMSGNEFADKLVDQVLTQGADIEMGKVTELKQTENGWSAITNSKTFEAKAVILATGVEHRMLGLENETNYVGQGISFCAVCDGAFYRDKTVAVIGGGNSALQEALLLTENCKKVIVVQNLASFTGEERLIQSLTEKPNIECIFNSVSKELIGNENGLQGLVIENTDGERKRLDIDGLFIAIGLIPKNDAFKDLVALNEYGYFDSDESCLTKTPGIFVAGDCRSKTIRQITTAASDGAIAALAACKYLDN